MFGSKVDKVAHAVEKQNASKLVNLVHDKDEAVRIAAIDGLGKIKKNEGVNPLINLLHDPSAEVRKHAALALGEIGDAHSKAHVNAAMEKETDAETKKAMLKALSQLKDY